MNTILKITILTTIQMLESALGWKRTSAAVGLKMSVEELEDRRDRLIVIYNQRK